MYWRDNLRDELEGLVYLRNGLNNDKDIRNVLKNKLIDVSNKFESFILKEIENLSDFIFQIEKNHVLEIDEKIFAKTEYLRDNYNKILLNIQKVKPYLIFLSLDDCYIS